MNNISPYWCADPRLSAARLSQATESLLGVSEADPAVIAGGPEALLPLPTPIAYGTLLALIRAGWAASRAAWGPNTPDVAGLADGRPDTDALLRWLDSPLARDADEAIGRLMPADGTPADRIGRAGRAAARALIAARNLIR